MNLTTKSIEAFSNGTLISSPTDRITELTHHLGPDRIEASAGNEIFESNSLSTWLIFKK